MRFYKVVSGANLAPFAYKKNKPFVYASMPKNGQPSAWYEIPADQQLLPCERGFHVFTTEDLPSWYATGRTIYEVEVKGEVFVPSYASKLCVRSFRFLRKVKVSELFGRQPKRKPKRAAKAKKKVAKKRSKK